MKPLDKLRVTQIKKIMKTENEIKEMVKQKYSEIAVGTLNLFKYYYLKII